MRDFLFRLVVERKVEIGMGDIVNQNIGLFIQIGFRLRVRVRVMIRVRR